MPPRAQSSKKQPETVEEKPSSEQPAAEVQPAAEAQPAADMALDDWCEAKSRTLDRRIESLSAFHRLWQKNGIVRAPAEQFEADFQKFMKAPA